MHSKIHKICTLKFLGCYLAQRVHGSKVEAKESTENSEALNWMSWNQVCSVRWSDASFLTRVWWVLQPTDSKWTVGWTDGTGIGSFDALGFGYSSGQGSALKHRTIRRLDHRFIRWLHLNLTETRQDFYFSTGWTDAWIVYLAVHPTPWFKSYSTVPSLVPSAPGDPTGRRCIASVHCPGFLVQRGYIGVCEWPDDSTLSRGHHRFIRRYNFSWDFFQRLASFARPINKPPASLELPLPLWRSIAA
jgi:hypothetical protein